MKPSSKKAREEQAYFRLVEDMHRAGYVSIIQRLQALDDASPGDTSVQTLLKQMQYEYHHTYYVQRKRSCFSDRIQNGILRFRHWLQNKYFGIS